MKYCMNCGVTVDETTHRVCPICETIILTDDELKQLTVPVDKLPIIKEKKTKEKSDAPSDDKVKKNKMGVTAYILFLFSIVSILSLLIIDISIGFDIDFSGIPILSVVLFFILVNLPFMRIRKSIYWYITMDTITLVIYFLTMNYIISHEISWSYYVVLSVLLAWVYLSSVFVQKMKSFVLRIAVDFMATAIFVLLVTLGLDTTSAFSQIALPINGLIFILTVITYFFIKTYIYNWRMIISTLSINISILCVGIDLFIENYQHDVFSINWSYIVLLVLIPFTIFMMYLDNRYKVHQYLSKKFHI